MDNVRQSRLLIIHKVKEKMHASVCSLVFFSQGRDTAAFWRQGRTGKTSGPLGAGDEPTPVWGTVWWRSTLDYTG
ncbi:hypothetical protein HMPREF0083_02455 [Aneurinibacillus aneurinilyticus ATCC 12856]|uniref:Uncharacterized protein n=1 Tax=Aneurinibacillus aneurinilyticus ATCC 12856 TaxID=649747 RepID=U1YF78_ANEAE|nr:hypothetical protein HMPREF0083_02455 [Aneurinibacillus aneurinilyticus ATCC 12856]